MISGSLRTLSKAESAAWQALHGCTPSSQAAIGGPASQLCIGSWLMPDLAMATQRVQVRLMFGSTIKGSSGDLVDRQIEVRADGSDTLLQVKEKISAAFEHKVQADQLLLFFGPNERKMGKQFQADPSMDDSRLRLKDYSCLVWLQRFPHWRLGVKFLPPTPPPPGVAATAAAAMSEGKDVDKAISEARQKGEIPTLLELPLPWGKKPYQATAGEATMGVIQYPAGSGLRVQSTAA